ncbi:MAG: class I SAM-dependent methyltransferase [Gallionella sp.]|nr:class I SAM-dependent methyltransferase [Gallionella sp.]
MAFQYINRNEHLPATASEISDRFNAHDAWEMTDSERLALIGLLAKLRPECAIEIGIYRAGSLSSLSRYCKKVYALDIDPTCESQFRGKFQNVEFVTGDSKQTLPQVLAKIEASQESLGLVLIDADHSREGIQHDIDSILRYTPSAPLYIVMHDSFNPECRKGIKEANWSISPHVHLVELDFVAGRFLTKEEPESYKQMWCGFGLAILLPEKRNGNVIVHENESLLYQTTLRHSVYGSDNWWNPTYLARELKYRAKCLLRRRAPGFYETLRRKWGTK